MDDQTLERTTERIRALLSKWRPLLGLGPDWTINAQVLREGLPPSDGHTDDSEFGRSASVEVHWEYLSAGIRFDGPICAELDDEDLEDAVVHELVHVLTYEFREYAPDRCGRCGSTDTVADGGAKHEERVVTRLTQLFRTLAKERA